MSNEATQRLQSLLDKVAAPIESIALSVKMHGVFGFPDDWKTTDDLNPNVFTYQAKLMGCDLYEGKVRPREATEKEIKEAEEVAAAKNKKPVKVDPKNPIVEPVLTADELEAQRLLREKEEEEDRRIQAEWDALDEAEKTFRTYEDKHKHPWVHFEKQEITAIKEGESLVILEERVQDEHGEYIYFSKLPTLNEDELAKLRKAKPKNLNLNDLNGVIARAWVDLSAFRTPGTTEFIQRCYLEQVFPQVESPDIVKVNFEKTFVKLTIRMDKPITPVIEEVVPSIRDLIPAAPAIPQLPASKQCITDFKAELVLAMESLAIEYSQFGNQHFNNANPSSEKAKGFAVQKAQESQSRKELFLYHFNKDGKYKVLKERIKKSIVKICRDKFLKTGSITGITTDQRDQFYSELYVFLMEQSRSTLSDLISTKKEELHEDIVTTYEQSQKERDRTLQQITHESEKDKLIRLAMDYEILNQVSMAEKNYKNLVQLNKRDGLGYFAYAKYLLRSKNIPKAEEMLEKALQFDVDNKEYQFLMAAVLLRRNKVRESILVLRGLLDKDPSNILNNIFLSFAYLRFTQDSKLAEKYKRIAERLFLRKEGILQAKNNHKKLPNSYEVPVFKPSISDPAAAADSNKSPSACSEQWDVIYLELVEFFQKNRLIDLVEKSLDLVAEQSSSSLQLLLASVFQSKGKFDEALAILDKVLETNRTNIDVLMNKANICYISDKLEECEETLLKALAVKNQKEKLKQYSATIYLRLGYAYLTRQQWGDAKAVFARGVENKSNSSLAWLGLGIANLRIGWLNDAEEALSQANIYDPFCGDSWGYLALLCLVQEGRLPQANQALRELFKTDISDLKLLEELGDQLSSIGSYDTAEKLYLKIFEAFSQKQSISNYGEINMKLGKVYIALKKYQEALNCFEEAQNTLESETDRKQLIELIETAKQFSHNPQLD